MEDILLLWRFKQGSSDALTRIYAKYAREMFTLAAGLVRESNTAEDIVHDVFVKFAQSGQSVKIAGNLRSFLMTSIANRARDLIRERSRHAAILAKKQCQLEEDGQVTVEDDQFDALAMALAQLSYEQQEVILLHLRSGLKFKAIAEYQGVSNDTVRSRYRYGLEKLRSILKSEVSQ